MHKGIVAKPTQYATIRHITNQVSMNNSKLLVPLAIVLGIVFLIITYVYATHAANVLPSFFPGYDLASNKIHTKHAIAAFVLAVGSFVWAWFQSGPKSTSEAVEKAS
jgi:uncharacterized membrane protein